MEDPFTKVISQQFRNVEIPLQMIAVGAILLSAYVLGRLFRKFRLSEVTGQMIGGACVGAYALHAMGILKRSEVSYDVVLGGFHFFVFVYLCLVAFGIGEELHISNLRKIGRKALVISLLHSIFTFGLVSVSMAWLGSMPWLDSMLIGAISITSAPAIAFVLMNQMKIEGHLRHMAAGVLVITDMFGILIFSLLTQIVSRPGEPAKDVWDIQSLIAVLREVGLACLLGVLIFLILKVLVRKEAALSEDFRDEPVRKKPFLQGMLAAHPSPSAEILLITMGAVSLGTGIAYYFHLPFLLAAVVSGFMVANLHSFAIFDSLKIDNITAVFNLMFFAMVGASMSMSTATQHTLWLALIYIVMRTTGKMVGTHLSCRLAGEAASSTRCLPSQLVPQTGVAAVEAVFVSQALNKPELAGIILIGIVFFGIAGVFQVELSLKRYRRDELEEDRKEGRGPIQSGISEAARRLLGYLSPESIMLELKSSGKTALIEEMLLHGRSISPQHIDYEQALHMLLERERLAPTGMGHGIALPHCRLISLDQPLLILGRHQPGVVFGGVDDLPCNLILMILTSGRNPSEHLQIMAIAAHLFNNADIRKYFLTAKNTGELLQGIIDIAEEGSLSS